ncbi:MAG: hypothetical protein WEE03_12145 [Chloroflexota bacterium]
MVAVLRLGLDERGITEIMAIAEHVVSVIAAAEGLRLRPDVPDRPTGPGTELVGLASAPPDDARSTLAEIARAAKDTIGIDHVPAFWSALAQRPRLLDAVWAKHLLVLGAGQLDVHAKLAVALSVAMNKRSPYWTSYLAQQGRCAGDFDDDVILEIAAATLHYAAFNTISHGMMLEAPDRDLAAADYAPRDRTE